MPVPERMAHAAAFFRQNHKFLEMGFAGIEPAEWLRRPNECTNNLIWIAGHLVWARSLVLRNLEAAGWTRPWLDLFARGSVVAEPEKYPAPDEVVAAWSDLSATVDAALEVAAEDVLAKPAKPPSVDGTRGGMIDFLAYHETLHVGQVAYLRRWLGHDAVMG